MLKTLAFAAGFVAFAAGAAHAELPTLTVGQPAPEFTAVDTNGAAHKLSDFRGKTVVLEWTNHQCPYVVKHYASGNMQATQKAATEDGAVWLSIVSSAEGKQGYVTAAEANALTTERKAQPTAVLLDPTGEVGKLYGAKTTPHMYIINADGALVYEGAIDDKPTTDQADIAGATNYVTAAMTALTAGQPVAAAQTKPYGCSVKYGS